MPKSRRKNTSTKLYGKLKATTKRAVPVLKKVGKSAVVVAEKSAPVLEKGMGKIYGVLAEGFDMGLRGVKSGVKSMKMKKRSSRKSRKSRRRH